MSSASQKNQYDWILVDGSSYLFRAYHAMPEFNNRNGQPTGAVYGVVNMLKRLFAKYSSKHVAVIFDAPGKTFRNDMYSEYKANRPPMPDDLRQQISWVHSVIEANGWPILCISGVEADDVIGTIAKDASENLQSMLISSGDKDLAQLVDEYVCVVDSMKNVVYDEAKVIEKFGVKPDQIIDYLALVGDSADNIPGIPGVGPKTATKWLTQYNNIETLIENADDIKGKIGEKFRANLSLLPLSKDLATLKCDVEIGESYDNLSIQPKNKEKLIELYTELDFNSWIQLLNKPQVSGEPSEISVEKNIDEAEEIGVYSRQKFSIIDNLTDWKAWQEKLLQANVFAIDTETDSLNAYQAKLVGISIAVDNEAAYIPLAHELASQEDMIDTPQEPVQALTQLTYDDVLPFIQEILQSPNHEKVLHNLKYDQAVLAKYDIEIKMPFHDTMIMSYVIDSTRSKHDMNSLSESYLNHKPISYQDVAGKGKAQISFAQVPIEQAADYASEDAEITLALYNALQPKLTDKLKEIYDDLDLPLVNVLEKIERQGIKLDVIYLQELTKHLETKLQQVQQLAFDEAGEEFNISSPKQIQHILYDKMNIPVVKKTPKGQPSTSEEVLQELAETYKLPEQILTYRSLSKLISTYTKKLPLVVDDNMRVHSSFHQAVAVTGRLSSSDPNLQNIPIRTEEGRKIREAFVAPKGYKMVAADYSQIELRIMAHLSQDENLLDAFRNNQDVHSRTAAEIFGVDINDVAFEQRRFAKAINFGLIYGMSAFGLAKQLGIGRKEAQDYIDLYFQRYPGVKRFMDEIRVKAAEDGFVETVSGRRLYLPEINSKNFNRRQYAERTAINAPMQGTAADLIKKAMIDLHQEIESGRLNANMILQVHDELIFEVPENEVEETSTYIKQKMTGVADLAVPLKVDVGIGDNWEQAH